MSGSGGITHWKNQPLPVVCEQTHLHNSSNAIILRSLLFPDYEPPTAAVPKPNYTDRNKGRTQFGAVIYGMYDGMCVLYKKWRA